MAGAPSTRSVWGDDSLTSSLPLYSFAAIPIVPLGRVTEPQLQVVLASAATMHSGSPPVTAGIVTEVPADLTPENETDVPEINALLEGDVIVTCGRVASGLGEGVAEGTDRLVLGSPVSLVSGVDVAASADGAVASAIPPSPTRRVIRAARRVAPPRRDDRRGMLRVGVVTGTHSRGHRSACQLAPPCTRRFPR